MATEVQIAGTPARAKIRSPWAAALLPIVTLGIYAIFWYYFINREMADYGRAKNTDELGDSPGKSVLAVTLGAIIIVPAVISVIHTAQRIQKAQKLAGVEPQLNGWLAVVMALLITPVFYAYEQSELNKVWRTMETGAPPAIGGAQESVSTTEPTETRPVEP
jgi:TRAP-type C4-dicarboxylate transport system permease large subunit